MNKPNKLYHYTRIDKAIRWILPNMELRLNCIKYMNDPSENLSHIANPYENIGYENKTYFSLDKQYIANHFQTSTKILSFSVDRTVEYEKVKKVIKGYQLQRMWSQYAENSSGICLVLNYDSFVNENSVISENQKIIDGFVTYNLNHSQVLPTPSYGKKSGQIDNSECICNFISSLESNDKFVKERFFQKDINWQEEAEYRFLTFNQTEEIFLSIKNSLEKVILGISFSKYYLPSIRELVDSQKIEYTDPTQFGEFISERIY